MFFREQYAEVIRLPHHLTRHHFIGVLAAALLGIVGIGEKSGSAQSTFGGPSIYRPVKIVRSSESYPSDHRQYGAEAAIDGNPATYACLLDDCRTGNRAETIPPFAASPVTGELTVDLGEPRTLSGVSIQCRETPGSYHPKNVDFFRCAGENPEKNEIEWILRDQSLPPEGNGKVYHFRFEKPVKTRYLGIKINDSYECGAGGGPHYNFQIAEIMPFLGDPEKPKTPNPPDVAFPRERLHRDWAFQDGGLDSADWFLSESGAERPKSMVEKALAELDEYGVDSAALKTELSRLLDEKRPASDPAWSSLYLDVCARRRAERLRPLLDETRQLIYVKHCVLSGPVHYAWTDEVTDQQAVERIADFKPGAQLCRLTIHDDGTAANEVLLEKPNGMIRDPNLSFDAETLIFSMRDNYETDDFHLYAMNLADGAVRQVTRGEAVSDTEPAFLPDGDVVFQSTRCVQLTDCWRQAAANLYRVRLDGSGLRRLGFDQVHTNYPQLLDDGRIIYTRWEYNDRGQIFPQPLFAMNPDGTGQSALYGENSWWPTSILHARGVPGSGKIVAVASGHHTHQRGKLILIDRSRGTQGSSGIEFLAPRRPADIPEPTDYQGQIDTFGQDGEQFQYPFPLSEEEYLVTYSPQGWTKPGGDKNRILYDPPFGVYWMAADGRRELLAWDPTTGCSQEIPVMKRPVPPQKPSEVDVAKHSGHYYAQDVLIGEAMKGVERGTVKSLRVVALEYRAAAVLYGSNVGEAGVSHSWTPVACNNGSWDVKHVLGEVPVEEDGSVSFEAPARTPLYFQLLDGSGRVVQTMRSWTTLQPGETLGCIGCHENKLETYPAANQKATLAMKRPPSKLTPPFGPARSMEKLGGIDSPEDYLGVNAPDFLSAEPDGFSYRREIQPIWDRHCVSCHGDEPAEGEKKEKHSAFPLTGKTLPYRLEQCPNNGDATQNALRDFSASYLNLTRFGHGGPVNWISAQSRPTLLPPYFAGSAKSPLMATLEPTHYGVQVSEAEKRLVAAWIDLCVPFCGSYTEANQWNDEQKKTYEYFEKKRLRLAAEEVDALKRPAASEKTLSR